MYQLCAAERSQTPNSPEASATELVQLTVRAAPTALLTVPVGTLMARVGVGGGLAGVTVKAAGSTETAATAWPGSTS